MKVLHIFKTCYPETKGGIELAIRFLCSGCREKGIESTILTLGSSNNEYTFEGTKIVVVKQQIKFSSTNFSFLLFKKFIQLQKENDIIHFQYPWPTGDLLSFFTSKKLIVSYQSDIVKQSTLKYFYAPLEHLFLSKMDAIVASSPQYALSSKNLRKFKNKVSVIPLALDEKYYPCASTPLINKWENKVGSDFFLFIGVLRYYKGLNYLLEAAKINNLPVVIAGDGPEREKLALYIKEHQLTNVKMVGFITEEDKDALHKLSKAFVFPSHLRSEAFGLSLLEALSHGSPIISFDIGTGSSYVNEHNKTGFCLPKVSAKSFSNAMIKLNNSENIEAFSTNARAHFERAFTISHYINNYYNLYQKLLNE
ncbi:MAG TPA: glycosyltransferase [Psychromonas hadalis]|nr:glycosyltransferase [Psychromonas hadalis]